MRKVNLGVLAFLFTGAGFLHLVHPKPFMEIVPAAFPKAGLLVFLSGLAEIVGGLGILLPGTRTAAGWALAALLIAVFPANIYMAQKHIEPAGFIFPPVLLWLRLPLQPLLMSWVIRSTQKQALN